MSKQRRNNDWADSVLACCVTWGGKSRDSPSANNIMLVYQISLSNQHQICVYILVNLINGYLSTIILSLEIVAVFEIYPNWQQLLHRIYQIFYHLLTNMDECCQVVLIKLLV